MADREELLGSAEEVLYNSTNIRFSDRVKLGLTVLDGVLLLAVFLDTFGIFIICCRKHFISRPYVKLMLNFALSNVLMGLFLAYHGVSYYSENLKLTTNQYFCLGQMLTYLLPWLLCMCSLFFLAVERCEGLRDPFRYKVMSERVADSLVMGIWVYAGIMATFPVAWLYHWSGQQCLPHLVVTNVYLYIMIGHIAIFLVCLLIFIGFLQHNITHHVGKFSEYFGEDDELVQRYVHYLKRSALLISILLPFFFIAWAPYWIVIILQEIGAIENGQILGLLHVIFFYWAFLFHVFSPLLIIMLDRLLRTDVQGMLAGIFARNQPPDYEPEEQYTARPGKYAKAYAANMKKYHPTRENSDGANTHRGTFQ